MMREDVDVFPARGVEQRAVGDEVEARLREAGALFAREQAVEHGFQAVQVELNRALYLDETTLEPTAGFARCKSVLDRIIAAVTADDWR